MSENTFHIITNISDKVIDYNQKNFNIVNEIDYHLIYSRNMKGE